VRTGFVTAFKAASALRTAMGCALTLEAGRDDEAAGGAQDAR
jgi:hypothetical protein